MKAVVFDLDGTLTQQNGEGIRSRFQDVPVEGVRELAEIFSQRHDYDTLLLTARTRDVRESTEEWLEEHDIDYDRLMMRPVDEFDSDRDYKEDMLDKLRDEGYDVEFAVEDLVSISDMWRENDVTCLQVGENTGGTTSFLRSVLGTMPSPFRRIYFSIHSFWFDNFRT